MQKESLIKNCIDLSLFLNELYDIKYRTEKIIIELEKMKDV